MSGPFAMFGDAKFGTFKFGKTSLGYPRFGLRVDWDSDGLFDGSNELTAADAAVKMLIRRGRRYTVAASGDGLQREDTGSFSVSLVDRSRRYDPYNEQSPLYGLLAGGKRFDLRVRTPQDAVYPLFAGVMSEPLFGQERSGMHTARLEGVDGWGYLRDQQRLVTVPLQEDMYADEIMSRVLDEAGWAWGRSLQAGIDRRPFWWADRRSPAAAIHELAHDELGRVYAAANGDIVFRNVYGGETPDLYLSGADVEMGGAERLMPSEAIRNIIRVRSERPVAYDETTLWQMQDRLRVLPGQTIGIWAEYGYNNQPAAAKDPVTPVATSDYTATANQDGSGASMTADIDVVMYPYATRAFLSVKNNAGSTAWFLSKLRGKPIFASDATTFEGRDEESIRLFGARPFDLRIQQDVNTARQYEEVLRAVFAQGQVYWRLRLLPNPAVQFAIDLGQQVVLSMDGVNDVYRVIYIEHESDSDILSLFRTMIILEPVSRVLAGVQIPVQVPFQVGQI